MKCFQLESADGLLGPFSSASIPSLPRLLLHLNQASAGLLKQETEGRNLSMGVGDPQEIVQACNVLLVLKTMLHVNWPNHLSLFWYEKYVFQLKFMNQINSHEYPWIWIKSDQSWLL